MFGAQDRRLPRQALQDHSQQTCGFHRAEALISPAKYHRQSTYCTPIDMGCTYLHPGHIAQVAASISLSFLIMTALVTKKGRAAV